MAEVQPTLQARIFNAIHALKRPVSEEAAENTALEVIAEFDASKAREFKSWFAKNGTQLVKMLNEEP